jgi:hypothetical protein
MNAKAPRTPRKEKELQMGLEMKSTFSSVANSSVFSWRLGVLAFILIEST